MDNPRIRSIVDSVKDLPPLPTTLTKINEVLQGPNASIADLTKVISLDQTMVTKILRVCNSPFYGVSQEITSISHAATYLGFAALQSIATSYVMSGVFRIPVDGYKLEEGELWRHSVACAISSRVIAERNYSTLRDSAFTAGLLHDIGKLILSKHVSKEGKKITDLVVSENISFNEAKRRILGFDHTEVGKKVAEKWRLAQSFQDAIRYHHEPFLYEGDDKIPHIVHVADCILMMTGLGVGIDGLSYPFSQESLDICGLTEDDVEEVLSRSLLEFRQTESFFFKLGDSFSAIQSAIVQEDVHSGPGMIIASITSLWKR